MLNRGLTATFAVAALGLAACGDENGGDARTATPTAETEQSGRTEGDAVRIKTRITNAAQHAGQVVSGSVIGNSAFCRGGKTTGGSNGPTIKTTFHCSDRESRFGQGWGDVHRHRP
jgi:hypothetical protein